MTREIQVIHTNQLDINNDEILLYFDTQQQYLTDDGYCSFEFMTHGVEFNIRSAALNNILKRYSCKIKPNHDIVKLINQTHYTTQDIKALTSCYQEIQNTLIAKG